jgi:N-acetylmuramidase/Putative peptidoglycan binding domain
MSSFKLNSKGEFVKVLQEMLQKIGYKQIVADGNFGRGTDAAVRDFQKNNNLLIDGVVGPKTWILIADKAKPKIVTPTSETDIETAARLLNCEVAAIKAVNEIESGGRRGFLADGKIMILFEGLVFWKELKKMGINPNTVVKGNENVLYESWTKVFYQGGTLEHDRLNKAIKINKIAALASASYGKFQIMGNNFAACGFTNVEAFVEAQKVSEGNQILAFVAFLKTNKLDTALRNKNWKAFAKGYNGPAYAANKYDEKLEKAYNKYK